MAMHWEGSEKLKGKSDEEVETLAQRGREMFSRNGFVPKDTDESHAIARVLRKSGVFGKAASLLDIDKSNIIEDK